MVLEGSLEVIAERLEMSSNKLRTVWGGHRTFEQVSGRICVNLTYSAVKRTCIQLSNSLICFQNAWSRVRHGVHEPWQMYRLAGEVLVAEGSGAATSSRSIGGRLVWRRSRRCEHAACIEFAVREDSVYVRDSKEVGVGEVLVFRKRQFDLFLCGVKVGEFSRAVIRFDG